MSEQKKSLKIADVLIQKSGECSEYLTRPLFQVNIQFLKSLEAYKKIVVTTITHMKNLMLLGKFADYPRVVGISGANVGVPWNIIIVPDKKTKNKLLVMINPSIIRMSNNKITLKTNCGSLNLSESIDVARRTWIDVSFYDVDGCNHQRNFTTDDGYAGTVQHEIDHNRGVLITNFRRHL